MTLAAEFSLVTEARVAADINKQDGADRVERQGRRCDRIAPSVKDHLRKGPHKEVLNYSRLLVKCYA